MNSFGIVCMLTVLFFPMQVQSEETEPAPGNHRPSQNEPKGEAGVEHDNDKETDTSTLHHRKAEAYFRAKRYKEAAEEFLKAYSLHERPAFLYLAADAYERAGSFKDAEKMYRRYLKEATDKSRIKIALEKLKELETHDAPDASEEPTEAAPAKDSGIPAQEKDSGTKKKPDEDKTPVDKKILDMDKKTPSPARPRSRMELGAWALVGSTAVLLTITGVFALKIRDCEDNMKRLAVSVDPNDNLRVPYEGNYRKDYERYKRDGELFQSLTWVFAGLSAAAVTGSAVLFTIDYVTRRRKSVSVRNGIVRPVISRDGGGVQMELRF